MQLSPKRLEGEKKYLLLRFAKKIIRKKRSCLIRIKKFKNGNINLSIKEDLKNGYYDINNVENFIHGEMWINDLYIEIIGGYLYILDRSNNNLYEFGFITIDDFLRKLLKCHTIKLYKLDKEVTKDLLQDLENGY